MSEQVEAAVESVKERDRSEPRGLLERYTAWSSGRQDQAMGFIVGSAQTVTGELAAILYDLHVMEAHAHGYARKVRLVKDWGYLDAARCSTRRAPVRGYRRDWAHQAARDGLCDALWGHLQGTGLDARSAQFKISRRQYQRVRDHVRDSARELMASFEAELSVLNALDLRETMY
jgi:hypothetical protein